MKHTLMIIGAGSYQLPGIIKAKEMGITTLAIDRDPDAPGLKIADISCNVDILDIPGAIRVAKEHAITGVMTISSDLAVPAVAAVAQELDLPGISPSVAAIATNKALMRETFLKHRVPSPLFCRVRTAEEAHAATETIGFPVVVKPVDNAGSRGVNKVELKTEMMEAFQTARSFSRTGEVIVEGFIEGIECTIEAMTYNNRTEILGISEKKKPAGHYQVATDLTYPPSFSNECILEIKRVITHAIKSMGINFGPTHSEVIVTPDFRVMLVEVAARGGGFRVFSDIIPLVSGVDATTENIKMCLGQKPDIVAKYQRSAVLRFFAPRPGILKEVIGFDKAKKVPNTEVGLFKSVGDTIPPLATDGDRTGFILAWGEDRAEAVRSADTVENSICFIVE
jgi:biotin carboxylase